ncbi:MAG: hypothetical protein O2892_18080 [Actinomycetota bacterium]|nr:hypothetical protein [Actinomycetota bacterium]
MKTRLTRNWLIGLAAVGATAGLGGIIAGQGGWKATAFGLFLAAIGVLAFGPLLMPWSADDVGVARAGRPLLAWPEVTAVEVRAFRTARGYGPPHVTVILKTPGARAVLNLYSRHDAERLYAILARYLPADVDGRELLWLIPGAWTAMD